MYLDYRTKTPWTGHSYHKSKLVLLVAHHTTLHTFIMAPSVLLDYKFNGIQVRVIEMTVHALDHGQFADVNTFVTSCSQEPALESQLWTKLEEDILGDYSLGFQPVYNERNEHRREYEGRIFQKYARKPPWKTWYQEAE